MTDPIEAAVLALDAEFDKDPDNDPSSHQLVRTVIDAYTKAVSENAVAWKAIHPEGIEYGKGIFDKEDADVIDMIKEAGLDLRPLFAAPQPAVPDGWRPIETAPKNGTRLLLLATINGKPIQYIGGFDPHWSGQIWVSENPKISGYKPNKWMPLPIISDPEAT